MVEENISEEKFKILYTIAAMRFEIHPIEYDEEFFAYYYEGWDDDELEFDFLDEIEDNAAELEWDIN